MKTRKDTLLFIAFLLPALASLVVVIIIPFLMGIYYSLTDWNGISKTVNFVGLQNYLAIFQRDPSFIHAFLITLAYAFLNVLAVNLVAIGLALLVTNRLKLTNVYRAAFFAPNLIGGLVLGYIWQFIYNNVISFYDFMPQMLAKPGTALAATVITSTWQYAGYIMMIYVAAIQSVPESLLEAAEMDGATYSKRFPYIFFPMIAQSFTICMFLSLTSSFKQFDVNISLTNGGPAASFMGESIRFTELMALNIYYTAFSYNKMGEGQAKAIIFFFLLLVVSVTQVYFSKKREVEA